MVRIEPLTADRWDDFEFLCRTMGPNRSCWCMYWRHDGAPKTTSAKGRAQALVRTSTHPIGLLAYVDDCTAGWAAVSPRVEYARLNVARDTAPVDRRRGVWAVPCFFVAEAHRHRGVARALLSAAIDLAATAGATAIEGVPSDPATKQRTSSATYTGTVELFRAVGFTEMARRRPKGRVVMRLDLRDSMGP